MLKNYLKIAWRNIRKQKFYSFINILGLTIGMTCCFLIFMYIRFELSYDGFHQKGDRIYRVVTDVKTPTELIESPYTALPMATSLKNDFPEVEAAVRVNPMEMLVNLGDAKYQEQRVVLADSSLFNVFSYPLLRGDAKTALVAPMSVVLSESIAKKYFGQEDALGKSIEIDGKKYTLKVTGVMKDIPENVHFPFDIVVSMSTAPQIFGMDLVDSWGSFGVSTYLLLSRGASAEGLQKKLPAFMEDHVGDMMKKHNMHYTLYLECLKDVYMHSKREAPQKGNLTNVYIFSIIALFILLIAMINFVNLATARATERAREVGVRKAVGAYERQLTIQFLCETILLSMCSFVLALLLCQLLLPAFNQLAGKEVAGHIFSEAIMLFLLLAIIVGLVAGIYPAIVLSSYKPVVVLKGSFSSSNKGLFLRRGLVVFQFMITIVLIAGVLVIYNQLTYLQERDPGFKKEQQMVAQFRGVENLKDKWEQIKREVRSVPGVTGATFSAAIPGRGTHAAYSNIEMKNGEMQASNIKLYMVDFDFIREYQVDVIAGRAFSEDMSTDSTQAMIVNEALVSSMGYSKPEEIIGKKFSQWGREGRIIGVIRNFNFESMREKVAPLTMRIEPGGIDLLTLTIKPGGIKKAAAGVEEIFNKYAPNQNFEYFFVNETFDNQYRSEYRFGRLVLTTTILAIFLATLGLLGLISYIVIQRTKEIGIRKVLGASVSSILFLLSKDFLQLVVIALLIATPLAWYLMYQWLQDFAYRIDIPWWIFLLAGFVAVAIALVTVSVQTLKAALSNPVRSLRTE